jgi:hypothetical protein
MRYGGFSGLDDYSADMRNTNSDFDLWQIQSADYSADMRKSIPDQRMWPSGVLAQRARVRARFKSDVSEWSKLPFAPFSAIGRVGIAFLQVAEKTVDLLHALSVNLGVGAF